MTAVASTRLPLHNLRRGKVRDVYRLPTTADAPTAPDQPEPAAPLLIVATDRISAFDVVMRTPIPGKGRLLTATARRWFDFIEARRLAPTHTIAWHLDPEDARRCGLSPDQTAELQGRVCIARPARVVPVECVVRGYLDGSGWREYQNTGAVCGVTLPKGLRRGDRLTEPIFTPATKAEDGEHDQNISSEQAASIVGRPVIEHARQISIDIYNAAHQHAAERGIIIADTKFEFGFPAESANDDDPAELMLIDEALTPDSSRYWPADQWKPGGPQVSFDKQFVREHLQTLVDRGEWDKTPDADGLGPALPDGVIEGTLARYREALERLWGETGVA